MRQKMVALVFLSLFIAVPLLVFGDDWIKTGEEDGITTYKKNIVNSSLVAFKGEGFISSPFEKVATVVFDTNRAPEWVEDLLEAQVLLRTTPNEYLEYDHVGTPFIIKDRVFVSKIKMDAKKEPRTLKFLFTQFDNSPELEKYQLPINKYVLGSLHNSNFVLRETGDPNKTWMVGEIFCDPKGAIPKWIVNLIQKNWPIKTFKNLRKQAAKTDLVVDPKIKEFFQ